jgi:hypothetical protein
MEIMILPENQEEKFLFMKEKIEERFSKVNASFPFTKPEIDEETLNTLKYISNFWQVYYYTDSTFIQDSINDQILSCLTLPIGGFEVLINKNKGKLFVFYSAKGSYIRGEFIQSPESINRHRDVTIDKLLD